MAYKLFIRNGESLSTSRLVDGVVEIGRSSASDVVIPESFLSRRHLRLKLAGSRLWVIDLGSTNGTWIDGVRIAEHELQPHEVIELGNSSIWVESEASGSELADRVTDGAHQESVGDAAVQDSFPFFSQTDSSPIEAATSDSGNSELDSLLQGGFRKATIPNLWEMANTITPPQPNKEMSQEQKSLTSDNSTTTSAGRLASATMTRRKFAMIWRDGSPDQKVLAGAALLVAAGILLVYSLHASQLFGSGAPPLNGGAEISQAKQHGIQRVAADLPV